MVRIENVSHYYKSKNADYIIKDISFEINNGEFLALTGASGCGKSTIASIVAGFLFPITGSVSIENEIITGKPSKKILLLNQQSDLFPWQSVKKDILFVVEGASKKEKNEKADELLKMVKLENDKDKYPFELSGGMQKRLSLARALAVEHELLILDEAFASLDVELKLSLYDDLKKIWNKKNTSVLLISHDKSDVLHMADREIILSGSNPSTIYKV